MRCHLIALGGDADMTLSKPPAQLQPDEMILVMSVAAAAATPAHARALKIWRHERNYQMRQIFTIIMQPMGKHRCFICADKYRRDALPVLGNLRSRSRHARVSRVTSLIVYLLISGSGTRHGRARQIVLADARRPGGK